jgi:hypothetical protein
MTTETKTQPIEAAFGQFKEINEQLLDAARKAGAQYLETYEKAVDRAIDLERKLAGATKQDWLKNLIDTQIDMTKEFTDAYTSTVRSILK